MLPLEGGSVYFEEFRLELHMSMPRVFLSDWLADTWLVRKDRGLNLLPSPACFHALEVVRDEETTFTPGGV